MENEYLDINEAIETLKDGLVLKDLFNSYFVLKRKCIYVHNDNSNFSLDLKTFKELYSKSKFRIHDDKEELIDIKKDEEYYNFKHK